MQGVPVTIPCPAWCVHGHAGVVRSLEDIFHSSSQIAVSAPSGSLDEVVYVLSGCITHFPFARTADRGPVLELDAAGDADCAELTAVEANAFADQLVAHAASMRDMARVLADAEAGVR